MPAAPWPACGRADSTLLRRLGGVVTPVGMVSQQTVPPYLRADGFLPPESVVQPSLQDVLATIPPNATIKGMFVQGLLDCLPRDQRTAAFAHKPQLARRRVGFTDQPLTEFVEVAVGVAAALFPRDPFGLGLRQLGAVSYDTFLKSLTGRVVFGVLGGDIQKLVHATTQAYRATQSHGRAVVVESSAHHCLLRYTDLFQFLGSLEVGVVEAAVRSCGLVPEVRLKLDSPHAGLLAVRFLTEEPESLHA